MDIQKILELHKRWLNGDTDGVRANLQDTDLHGANLRGANLRGANLRGADLQDTNLQDTDLRSADLRGANLRGADLRGANLRGANLQDTNLRGADVDYSCLPLWCGSLHMKVDKRIAAQIAYHFCALECDDPEVQETQRALYALANTFHRVGELPRLGERAMPKYISAADAAEKISEQYGISFWELVDVFRDIPAADVREIVHARWKYDVIKKTVCSVCGGLALTSCYNSKQYRSPYCPNCAAKMDGGINP